jgi:hypothetical protein
VILVLAYSMLQFHRKFSTGRESINSDRCNQRDADGDGVLPAADGARGPWQRTLAGNGDLGERIAPVSRGRVGTETRGVADPVACATILLVCLCAAHSVLPLRRAPRPRAACRSNRLQRGATDL